MSSPPLSYRLVRPTPVPVAVPVLDAAQQAVVDHRDGPLLVLAGPGTGKTTTVVEAVVGPPPPRAPPPPGGGAPPRGGGPPTASTTVVVLPVPGPARTR
ncbi:MAG: AAA family ATPase, partial [Spirochaetaceae bacterium]|nr:AAA family ATPase [Spirochaetaceae bacterium]